MFEHDGDELPIMLAESGGRKLLVLFNLGDDNRVQKLPEPFRGKAGKWTEFWSGEPCGMPAGGEVSLAPRSARPWWI